MRGTARIAFGAATIVAACLGSPVAVGQSAVLLGTEFQANTFTTSVQFGWGLAMEADGGFVAVWSSDGQDFDQSGVFGQRYASSGAKLGAEFQVNTFGLNDQSFPAVAADADGDFVVVWQSNGADGSSYGIAGQRFDSSGSRLASEFRVNTYTPGQQSGPTVASEANGDFVVAWSSDDQDDGSATGVFARRFASNGIGLASEFQVNTFTPNYERFPAIDLDDDGDFVIVWQSSTQDVFLDGIFGQRFDSLGAPQGPEFRANHIEYGDQDRPAVALDSDGDFTVVWSGPGAQYGSAIEILARRFASNGVTPGLDLTINESWSGDQGFPSIGMAPDGSFIVAWLSADGNQAGVFARRFSAAGFPTTGDFQVNTYVNQNQIVPKVGASAGKDFVAIWSSNGQDGSSYGVFGRRIRVSALIDVDGDGAITPLTDSLLILRHSFGFTGDILTSGAVGPNCTRCDSATIVPYLQSLR